MSREYRRALRLISHAKAALQPTGMSRALTARSLHLGYFPRFLMGNYMTSTQFVHTSNNGQMMGSFLVCSTLQKHPKLSPNVMKNECSTSLCTHPVLVQEAPLGCLHSELLGCLLSCLYVSISLWVTQLVVLVNPASLHYQQDSNLSPNLLHAALALFHPWTRNSLVGVHICPQGQTSHGLSQPQITYLVHSEWIHAQTQAPHLPPVMKG